MRGARGTAPVIAGILLILLVVAVLVGAWLLLPTPAPSATIISSGAAITFNQAPYGIWLKTFNFTVPNAPSPYWHNQCRVLPQCDFVIQGTFTNTLSTTVAVSVNGTLVCNLQPGSTTCSGTGATTCTQPYNGVTCNSIPVGLVPGSKQTLTFAVNYVSSGSLVAVSDIKVVGT